MRQIKVSEIKPGMTIRWTHNKVTYECPVMGRDDTDEDGGVLCHVSEMHSEYVDAEAGEVTVLSEPAPAQPEEPTEFGAKVRVHNGQYVRLEEAGFLFRLWYEMGTGRRLTWEELCEMGPVTVIPDQGWTVPDTPEVPDRIEEWPKNDEHLRAHPWIDADTCIWTYQNRYQRWGYMPGPGCKWIGVSGQPSEGPWERGTGA